MGDNIGLIVALAKKHGGGNGTSKKNFSKVVTPLEWVLVSEGVHSGFYKLDVLHSLKSSDILVEFYENNISSNLTGVEIVDENTISLYNDTALNGKVVVNGGFNEGTSLNNEQVTNINKIPQMERDIASNKTTLEGITKDKINNWNSAYTHSQSAHAPANAQRNSDITKAEIEAKLVGDVNTHSHSSYEPVISNKGTAFNKNFGTNEGDIAQGNHTHTGYANASHRHNTSEIDGLSSGGSGVNVEIVNDLTTGGIDKVLSAEQGKVIKSSLDSKMNKADSYNKVEIDKKISDVILESGNIVFEDVIEGEIFEIEGTSQPVVPVQSIALNKLTHTFKVDETVQLTPTFNPTNATNKNVTWSSNNANCTVVGGLVAGKIEGESVITCTSLDGNKTATCTMTVQAKDVNPPVGDITDSLEGWWQGDSYTGKTLQDKSGKGRDITLDGSPVFDGTKISFNGNGKGTVDITDTDILTLEFVSSYNASTLSSRTSIISTLQHTGSAGMCWGIGGSYLDNLNYGTVGAGRISPEAKNDNAPFQWRPYKAGDGKKHFIVRYNDVKKRIEIIVNGVEKYRYFEVTAPFNATVNKIGIGIWSTIFTEGDLNNTDFYLARAYSKMLTDEEVLRNYNQAMGGN